MPDFNIARHFLSHARSRPDHLALVLAGTQLTYGELATRSLAVTRWLEARCEGRRPERVGVLASRTLPAYAGIVGSCLAGATYVPINPRIPVQRLAETLAAARLDALVADGAGATALASLPPGTECPPVLPLATDAAWPRLPEEDWRSAAATPVESGAIAYIIFTSGTTGKPKGVMVTVDNVHHYVEFNQERYGFTPDDRFAQFSEIAFDVSVYDLFLAWRCGGSIHVVPPGQLMAPAGFIREQRVTSWASVPSVIAIMDRVGVLKPDAFPSLRVSYFCGDALPLASAEKWRRAAPHSLVDNHYGPTETTVTCTVQRFEDPPNVTREREIVSIGLPYPGMHALIVDEDLKILPAGTPGELALAGTLVSAGYLGDPELTARRYPEIDHPSLGRLRWYLSGDRVQAAADGSLHHLGRIDNQVKVMGYRIELEEIEAHLRSICDVTSVAAVAWPIENGTASGIVAFVAGSTLEPVRVQERMRQRVPAYMVPARIQPVEELPLNANGKVDRNKLRALYLAPAG